MIHPRLQDDFVGPAAGHLFVRVRPLEGQVGPLRVGGDGVTTVVYGAEINASAACAILDLLDHVRPVGPVLPVDVDVQEVERPARGRRVLVVI